MAEANRISSALRAGSASADCFAQVLEATSTRCMFTIMYSVKRGGRHRHGWDPSIQRLQQRLQKPLGSAPTPDGRSIDGRPDLTRARGLHRPLRIVERAAGIFPLQAAVGDQGTRLTLDIIDKLLVLNVDHHPLRQHVVPMIHQRRVATVIASEFAEIIGEWLVAGEKQGKAGIERIAPDVDDAGIRQRQMNETDEDKVQRQLVDDPLHRRSQGSYQADIAGTEVAQIFRRHRRDQFRELITALPIFESCNSSAKGFDLSGTIDPGMACQDFLDQCRTGTRHPDHKYRRARTVSAPGFLFHEATRENRSNALEQIQHFLLVIGKLPALERIPLTQVVERSLILLQVAVSLSQREMQ